MYEFWYQVERDDNLDGGEFFGSNAQECAKHIRELYGDDIKIVSILRVEKEWE